METLSSFKTIGKIRPLFINTFNQVRCNTGIERAISFAAQHIDEELFHNVLREACLLFK